MPTHMFQSRSLRATILNHFVLKRSLTYRVIGSNDGLTCVLNQVRSLHCLFTFRRQSQFTDVCDGKLVQLQFNIHLMSTEI